MPKTCSYTHPKTHKLCTMKARFKHEDNDYCGFHIKMVDKNYIPKPSKKSNDMQLALPMCSQITAKKTPCKCRSVSIFEYQPVCGRHKRFMERAKKQKKNVQELDFDCAICCIPLRSEIFLAKTNCGHMFHKKCILKWRESGEYGKLCPICKRNTNVSRKVTGNVKNMMTRVEVEQY